MWFWKKKEDTYYRKDASDIIAEEKEYIKGAKNPKDGDSIWGLGLSGGGIRSASLGLGVIQALVSAPTGSLLSKIDYLSTVSGGGYIGSALTWFLQKGLPDGRTAGTDVDNFPLGQKGCGARSDEPCDFSLKQKDSINCSTDGGNLVLDFIRQHGNYLIPGQGLNTFSLFGTAIRTMFISLLVYFSIIILVINLFSLLRVFNQYSFDFFVFKNIPPIPLLFWFALGVIVILIITSIIFSIRTYVEINPTWRYKNLIKGQKFIGKAWAYTLGFVLLGTLVYLSDFIKNDVVKIYTACSSISFGSILGLFQHKKTINQDNAKGSMPSALIYLAAFALIYGLFFAAYLLKDIHTNLIYISIPIAITFIIGMLVNLNYAGLHRMYRDRLMETFLPNAEQVKMNKWGAATDANNALLEDMCEKFRRPYHLINTNIILVDSPTTKFRSRGGDSFLLSKLYCGSDATGYLKTSKYMKTKTHGMTLASAMAISGAAVNPYSGVCGKGPTTNKIVSSLMGLLNLRLGYWAVNPKTNNDILVAPNYLKPGLNGDVLGFDLTEDKSDIQLTDGGHFENLALYELIRRKAKVIIISDASADGSYKFDDLANAIEKVRVDFGVKIRFDRKYNLNYLLPGSSKVDKLLTEKFQLADRGFAVANIYYQDSENTNGRLIYIKSTLTKDLPADIYGYKSANPAFPNQTTADQFFNEEQFEAYRELGYQLTKQMLKSKIGKEIFGLVKKSDLVKTEENISKEKKKKS